MNPNAPAFQFSASAATFTPGGAAAAPAAAAAAPAAAAAAPAAAAAAGAAPESWEQTQAELPDSRPTTAAAAEPAAAAAEPAAAQPAEKKKDALDLELEAELAALEVAEKKLAAEEAAKAAKADQSTSSTTSKKGKKEKGPGDKKVHDTREHLNVVFIGHVDAGKSTISGQILLLTNQVDERTIAKYEKEAKEKNRESWYLAYVMDTSEEERAKGKTVEVGRAHFDTPNKRYTLLDAPGHKNYVPNMIGGAAQADVGVLVISARKGEFETGFDRGGQTREHAMLAKTLGIKKLIVLVNKMDESTVLWKQERFDQIETKLSPFLKKWGYNVSKDVTYVPCSGYTGHNLKDKVPDDVCSWYKGKSLFDTMDSLDLLDRDDQASVRMPIVASYKEMGVVCTLGKLEQGTLHTEQSLIIMPIERPVTCVGLMVDEQDVDLAKPGENCVVKIKGIDEDDIHDGFVVCSTTNPCAKTTTFEAQIAVLDLLEHKPLVTSGYTCVLHCHAVIMECIVSKLVAEIVKGKKSPQPPKYLKSSAVGIVHIICDDTVAIETFKDCPQLGRFTLRDEGVTIAVGKILRLSKKLADKK